VTVYGVSLSQFPPFSILRPVLIYSLRPNTNVIGTMSLIRLAHAGRPKTFAFTSSVSTCLGIGHTSSSVPETPIGDDPSVSLTTGYALSKYIGICPSPVFLQTNAKMKQWRESPNKPPRFSGWTSSSSASVKSAAQPGLETGTPRNCGPSCSLPPPTQKSMPFRSSQGKW